MSEGLRKRRRSYLNLPSETIDNPDLSVKALGTLVILLNKPPGWVVRSVAIASVRHKDGRDLIQAALRELATEGYYRIERRHLLNGRIAMGTAVSEYPDPVWAAQYAECEGPIPCVQQPDGTFRVRRKDGTLVPDGFEGDEGPFDPNGGVCAGQAETGFSGSGEAGAGATGSGQTGSGEAGAGATGSGQTGTGPAGTGEPGPFVTTEESLREPAVPSGDDTRADVERLCEHLADLIEANGSKRPTVTKKWRDACRLMLDADARPEAQVLELIDWCQKDWFWKTNIMSMPTFREKYDRLRLKAQAEERQNGSNPFHQVNFDEEEYGGGYETPQSA